MEFGTVCPELRTPAWSIAPRAVAALTLAGALVGSSSTAHASVPWFSDTRCAGGATWGENPTLYIDNASMRALGYTPAMEYTAARAIAQAANDISAVKGSHIRIIDGGDTGERMMSLSAFLGRQGRPWNDAIVVTWDPEIADIKGGEAILKVSDACRIKRAMIRISPRFYGADNLNLESLAKTALHELMHAMGFHHSDDYSILNYGGGRQENLHFRGVHHRLMPDDRGALRRAYPLASSASVDLALHHHYVDFDDRASNGGDHAAYNVRDLCEASRDVQSSRDFDIFGGPYSSYCGRPIAAPPEGFSVCPGENVVTAVTALNHGTVGTSARIEYFFSNNGPIDLDTGGAVQAPGRGKFIYLYAEDDDNGWNASQVVRFWPTVPHGLEFNRNYTIYARIRPDDSSHVISGDLVGNDHVSVGSVRTATIEECSRRAGGVLADSGLVQGLE